MFFLSGRGYSDGPIACPKYSYLLWRVWVWADVIVTSCTHTHSVSVAIRIEVRLRKK